MAKGAGSIKALKALCRRGVGDNIEYETLKAELEQESDRACVILMGSILEDELLNLISTKLHLRDDLTNDELNGLLGPDGAIGTFSRKINVAYGFQLITKPDRDQLTIIREMRNACAHHLGPISFSTPELVSVVKNLMHPDNNPILPPYDGNDPEQLRYMFMGESILLATILGSGDREFVRAEYKKTRD